MRRFALVLVAFAAAAHAQPIAFGPPLHLAASFSPDSLAAADFNGDGRLDIVATNGSPSGISTVTVLLNTGSRTFGPAVSYPAGNNPKTVHVADFNHDGKLDVAVANNGDSTVAVLLGNGAGGFGAPITTPSIPSNLRCLTVGDFNGDTNPDVIVDGFNLTTELSVLLGDGSGALSAPMPIPSSGLSPAELATGDFNGDGRLDFAAASSNGTNTPGADGVSVHLGNGSGGFAAFSFYPVPPYALAIAAGHVDGNGSVDLVVASTGPIGGPPAGSMSTLLNSGTGTFGPAITLPLVPGQPYSVALADFNLDGVLDAMVGRATFDVIVLAGTGSGVFVPATNLATNSVQDVIAADFDGDGRPDAAVAAPGDDEVLVFFNGTSTVADVPLASMPSLLLLAALLAALAVSRLRA